MSENPPTAKVIVGVDTHKHVHVAVAINALGTRLGAKTISVGAKGVAAGLSLRHDHGSQIYV